MKLHFTRTIYYKIHGFRYDEPEEKFNWGGGMETTFATRSKTDIYVNKLLVLEIYTSNSQAYFLNLVSSVQL
jgi:hypothetical protein